MTRSYPPSLGRCTQARPVVDAAQLAANSALTGGTVSPGAQGQVGVAFPLARLAALFEEASGILRELSLEVQAGTSPDRRVNEPSRPPRLLSVRDVAERLALSEKTVRRLRRRGILPIGIDLGGVIRWRAEEIENSIGGSK